MLYHLSSGTGWKTTPYLRVFVLSIPDVGAGAHAVVSIVSFRLVDPLPAQILPKVNVKLTHAAGLCFSVREYWEGEYSGSC